MKLIDESSFEKIEFRSLPASDEYYNVKVSGYSGASTNYMKIDKEVIDAIEMLLSGKRGKANYAQSQISRLPKDGEDYTIKVASWSGKSTKNMKLTKNVLKLLNGLIKKSKMK